MVKAPPKRKRKPRPPKAPFVPVRPGQFLKQDLSLRQEKLIGRLIVAWSRLEAAMQDTIWHFLDLDLSDGRVLTARLDAKYKLLMLRTLTERHMVGGKNKDDMLDTLDDIEALYDDRNFVAHGIWAMSMPEHVPASLSIREKSPTPDKVVSETFPEGRMIDITQRMYAANAFLGRMMAGLVALRGRLPGPPRSPE